MKSKLPLLGAAIGVITIVVALFVIFSGANQGDSTESFTLAEVAEHNSAEDCWMAIGGNVYDVTDYLSSHPGGDRIVQGCGIDATELFGTSGGEGKDHPPSARALLQAYLLGRLD